MAQMNSNSVRRCTTALLFAAGALALGACATPPSDPAARAEFEKTNDPFEPLNRQILDFNMFIDRVALKPVAQGYVAVVPELGRTAVRNFLDNLGEPIDLRQQSAPGRISAGGRQLRPLPYQ